MSLPTLLEPKTKMSDFREEKNVLVIIRTNVQFSESPVAKKTTSQLYHMDTPRRREYVIYS